MSSLAVEYTDEATEFPRSLLPLSIPAGSGNNSVMYSAKNDGLDVKVSTVVRYVVVHVSRMTTTLARSAFWGTSETRMARNGGGGATRLGGVGGSGGIGGICVTNS